MATKRKSKYAADLRKFYEENVLILCKNGHLERRKRIEPCSTCKMLGG